jgi:hypothetical protein
MCSWSLYLLPSESMSLHSNGPYFSFACFGILLVSFYVCDVANHPGSLHLYACDVANHPGSLQFYVCDVANHHGQYSKHFISLFCLCFFSYPVL